MCLLSRSSDPPTCPDKARDSRVCLQPHHLRGQREVKPWNQLAGRPLLHPRIRARGRRSLDVLCCFCSGLANLITALSRQPTCLHCRRFAMEAAGTFHHPPHVFLLATDGSHWNRASQASPSTLTTGCQHPPLGCEQSQSGFSGLSFFGTKIHLPADMLQWLLLIWQHSLETWEEVLICCLGQNPISRLSSQGPSPLSPVFFMALLLTKTKGQR